jgi:hypothetical protein
MRFATLFVAERGDELMFCSKFGIETWFLAAWGLEYRMSSEMALSTE